MKFLSRDEIFKADDLPYKDVDVHEWGGKVRIRSLRGVDRSKLIEMSSKELDASDWIERMIIACTCDESGEPLFDIKDLDRLKKKNAKVLNRLFQIADDLNLISERSRDNLKGE